MSSLLLVETRKGLFTFRREPGHAWQSESLSFLGDPVTAVLLDARDGALHAGLNLGHFGVKLHRSQDLGRASAPDVPEGTGGLGQERRPAGLDSAVDQPADLGAREWWKQLARCSLVRYHSRRPVSDGQRWRELGVAAISLGPSGATRVVRRRLRSGGRPFRLGPSRRCRPRHAGVSCGGVWITRDGGESWDCRGRGMFAEYMPPEHREKPSIQDPHRLVQCAADPSHLWVQHHNGIFRSTDGGAQWRHIPEAGPSTFGFAVAVHPRDPETAWFVPAVKDEYRVPADGRFVVTRTRDGGRSFDVLDRGLPATPSYDIVYRHGLDVDASGDVLAMGSTTGGLWTSDDAGDTWHALSEHLPPVYCVRLVKV